MPIEGSEWAASLEETEEILLSNVKWKLGSIPAERWIHVHELAEEITPWISLSVDDFLLEVQLSEADAQVRVEFQAVPYVLDYFSEQKRILDPLIDLSDEKWQPMIENLEWGMSVEKAAEIVDMTEAEIDKEGYLKYRLDAPQQILGQEMEVFLYFNSEYDLGLAEIVGVFSQEEYNNALEEVFAIYGTAAQSRISARIGSIYSVFVRDVDTVTMGWDTYHQIVTELSPAEWPYASLTSYVITHRKLSSKEGIFFTGKAPSDLVRELKNKEGKDIWICGGANIVQQLVQNDLIGEYYISLIPTVLGSGIRLFGTTPDEIKLKLISSQTYNGIVELIYMRR